jgi:DNA-binding CsgD family transcriptional regulator
VRKKSFSVSALLRSEHAGPGHEFRMRFEEALTPRQAEVLALLAEGLSDETIANRLGISLGTLNAHRYNILRKCGESSRIGEDWEALLRIASQF